MTEGYHTQHMKMDLAKIEQDTIFLQRKGANE